MVITVWYSRRVRSVVPTSSVQLLLLAFAAVTSNPGSATQPCGAGIKTLYESYTRDSIETPERMITGHNLRVCTTRLTCCTADMEAKLIEQSAIYFDLLAAKKMSFIKQFFLSRTANFDAQFVQILNTSQHALRQFFSGANRSLYVRDTRIFDDLFNGLKSFYKGSAVILSEIFDSFFLKLAQDLFEQLRTLSGKNFRMDSDYIGCFYEQMQRNNSFDAIPSELLRLVQRSFVVARNLVIGLKVGRDILQSLSQLQPSESCRIAITGMAYCPLCQGLVSTSNDNAPILNIKPCSWLCQDVMNRCFSPYEPLNRPWNEYLDELLKVVAILQGHNGFEHVVMSISDRISEAIIKFHAKSENIISLVLASCGQPTNRNAVRTEREVSLHLQSPGVRQRPQQSSHRRQPTASSNKESVLERLVRESRRQIESSRDIWRRLLLCDRLNIGTVGRSDSRLDGTNRCWNGRALVSVSQTHLRAPAAVGSEVMKVEARMQSKIQDAIHHLKLITSKLKKPLDAIYFYPDSSYGHDDDSSGSGSGDDITKYWYLQTTNVSLRHDVNDPSNSVTPSGAVIVRQNVDLTLISVNQIVLFAIAKAQLKLL